MIDDKLAQNRNGVLLSTYLVGTCMAFLLFGKVFSAHGYTFITVFPSCVLLLCLWLPYLLIRFKK